MQIEDLLREFEDEARTTRRVLERIPSEQLDWRPHEKSTTIGGLAMHIAVLPARFTEAITTPVYEFTGRPPLPAPASTAEILALFDRNIAAAANILRGLNDAALLQNWRGLRNGQEIYNTSVGNVLRRNLLNHWYHHRGQMTVYLRLTGALVPSVYGPSADENPFLKQK